MNQKLKIGLAIMAGFTAGFALARILTTSNDKSVQSEAIPEGQPIKDKEIKKDNPLADDSFPLKLGSRGENVERLQVYLMRNLGWVRKPTAIFDLLTEERSLKHLKQATISKELFEKLMMNKMVHDQRKKKAA